VTIGDVYWRWRSFVNLLVSIGSAAIVVWAPRFGSPVLFKGDYGTYSKASELMLSVGSALLGFVIAAVTLLYALTSTERLSLLRSSRSYQHLLGSCKSSVLWLLLTTLTGMALIFLDPRMFVAYRACLIFVMIFVLVQATMNVTGLSWITSKLLHLS
jgi:hypothetical protein